MTEAHAGTRPRPDRDPLPPSLPLGSLLERNEGLVCLTGCAADGVAAGSWERGDPRAGAGTCGRLRDVFGRDRLRIERALRALVRAEPRSGRDDVAELSGRLAHADQELAAVRALLSTLRAQALS